MLLNQRIQKQYGNGRNHNQGILQQRFQFLAVHLLRQIHINAEAVAHDQDIAQGHLQRLLGGIIEINQS